MIQPNKWSCQPTALSIISGRPIELFLNDLEPYSRDRDKELGWTDLEVVAVAAKHEIYLVPLIHVFPYENFFRYYWSHCGLLVGKKPNGSGHCLAKAKSSEVWMPKTVIDPANGKRYTSSEALTLLDEKVFFVWINQPRTP